MRFKREELMRVQQEAALEASKTRQDRDAYAQELKLKHTTLQFQFTQQKATLRAAFQNGKIELARRNQGIQLTRSVVADYSAERDALVRRVAELKQETKAGRDEARHRRKQAELDSIMGGVHATYQSLARSQSTSTMTATATATVEEKGEGEGEEEEEEEEEGSASIVELPPGSAIHMMTSMHSCLKKYMPPHSQSKQIYSTPNIGNNSNNNNNSSSISNVDSHYWSAAIPAYLQLPFPPQPIRKRVISSKLLLSKAEERKRQQAQPLSLMEAMKTITLPRNFVKKGFGFQAGDGTHVFNFAQAQAKETAPAALPNPTEIIDQALKGLSNPRSRHSRSKSVHTSSSSSSSSFSSSSSSSRSKSKSKTGARSIQHRRWSTKLDSSSPPIYPKPKA